MKKVLFTAIILFVLAFIVIQKAHAVCIPSVFKSGVLCEETDKWPLLQFELCQYDNSKCCSSPGECPTLQEIQQEATDKIKGLCIWITDSIKNGECITCIEKGDSIYTAIGCIPTTPEGFVTKFLELAIGIAGGIAFLLILFGSIQMMTNAGNPEKLNAGKELVTAAISGLLLIIFSIYLLRLLGYTILRIPGFG